MNKLLKDAIADAKAVRETALANAKAALEEAFAPKLQSMLSHKIKEEMESEEEEEMEPAQDAAMEMERMQKNAGLVAEEGDEDMPADEEGMEDEMPADEEGMEGDDLEFSIGGQEYEIEPVGGEEGMEGEEDMEGEEGEVSDEELSELIAELEGEDEEEMEEATELDPNSGKYDADAETMEEAEDPEAKEMDEEVNLEEIIAALKEEEGEMDDEDEEEPVEEAKMKNKMKKMEEELNEAYSVVKFLRGKLSEVNLLNAKLLFVNKLFRKGELTESQKVKIIETFDRAKNVREAKLIYTTLAESVRPTKTKVAKKKMTEGLASAPQKKTQIISESNNVYERFKTLVNFNKQ